MNVDLRDIYDRLFWIELFLLVIMMSSCVSCVSNLGI